MLKNFPLYSDKAQSGIMVFEKYAVFLRKDNIIQIQMKDNFDCNLDDAKKIVECIIHLSNNKKYPLLSIYGEDNNFSAETKSFIASHQNTTADALVSNNILFNLIANFYLKFNKPVRPTRLFSNVDKAIEWLTNFGVAEK